jgi:hypothetical protein
MMKRQNYFLTALFFVTSVICGYLAASWFEQTIANRVWNGDSVHWQSIGSPPGGASRILSISYDADTKDIVVLSRDGKTYRCCSQATAAWEESQPGQVKLSEACGRQAALPAGGLPGTITDCAEVSNSGNSATRTVFVVLEDGEVWQRHLEEFLLAPLMILFLSSLLVGLMMGMALLWLWKRVRDTSPLNHNTIILSR